MARPPIVPRTTSSMSSHGGGGGGGANDGNTKPLALSLGPERRIYVHSYDPSEGSGLHFVHSSIDGRIRVSIRKDDDDDDDDGVGWHEGMIEGGEIYNDDVVREIAGIDARRPISEHMWSLTRGLMRVAPRPIEVVVATIRDDDDDHDGGDDDGSTIMVSSMGGDSYYQLDTSRGATVHKLGGKGGGREKESHTREDGVENEVDEYDDDIGGKVPTRDPFMDVGRFGPERRVVFHEDSLGVKLHRSPTEGIVRVLCLLATSTSTSNSVREGMTDDDDGKGEDVEPGDVILEVGGVDLRHKHIGAEEWADMVHFVKHVGRPLEMVVARDKTFVAPPATTTTTTTTTTGTSTMNKAVTIANADDVDAREEKEEMDVEENENENGGGIFDNVVCFSIRADEICNLPRVDEICNLPCPGTTGGGGVVVCGIEIPNRPPATTSPLAATANSSSATIRKAHPWDAPRRGEGEEEEDGKDDDDSVYAASVAVGRGEASTHVIVADVAETTSATTKMADDVEYCERTPLSSPVKGTVGTTRTAISTYTAPAPAATYVPFYSRTHPKGGGRPSPPSREGPSPPRKGNDDGINIPQGNDKLTVAQLREKFSPIKNPVPIAATTAKETVKLANSPPSDRVSAIGPSRGSRNTVAPSSPVALVRVKNLGQKAEEDSSAKTIRSLFSPMVVPSSLTNESANRPMREDATTPGSTSPKADAEKVEDPPGIKEDASPILDESANLPMREDVTTPGSTSPKADAEKVEDPPGIKEDASPILECSGKGLTRVTLEISLINDDSDAFAADVPPNDATMSPGHKREELARMIVKGNRRKVQDDTSPDPEPCPALAFDDTNESSFHEKFVHDLMDEFCSPTKSTQTSEGRDDINHRQDKIVPPKEKETVYATEPPSKSIPLLSGWTPEQQRQKLDLSPTGSTVSVENEKDPSTKRSDPFNSPFVGDVKFTPPQRLPSSALFSQAFLVQSNPAGEDGLINARWTQMNSPLFVTGNTDDGRTQPPQIGEDQFSEDRNRKTFGVSVFDLPQLDWNKGGNSLADAEDPEPERPYDELDETIVYAADSTEEAAQVACCSIGNVLDGFAQNCGIDSNYHRQTKDKASSPRKKNLLSIIRNKKKHPKNKKAEYGNLIDDYDDNNDEVAVESMKGVRKAHVQLAYQKVRGKSTARATQFTYLVDDEMCF